MSETKRERAREREKESETRAVNPKKMLGGKLFWNGPFIQEKTRACPFIASSKG